MPAIESTRERYERLTFLALLQALSQPGTVHTLSREVGETGMHAIAATLLDLETTFYTPDDVLRQNLTRLGSRPLPLPQADYLLFPRLMPGDLETLREASVGTLEYPDQAATLILGVTLDQGARLELSGPGVPGERTLQVAGLPAGLWQLRNQFSRYPLGWDLFLVDGLRLSGIPRSSQVRLQEE